MTQVWPLSISYALPRARASNNLLGAMAVVLWYLFGLPAPSRGDEFSRLDWPVLSELISPANAHNHTTLTLRELEALPVVLREERTAFIIVMTDQGNLAKLLLSPGLRKLKSFEKDGATVPVLIVERFETIDAGDHQSLKARGKEFTLFDGFQFDLDAGQVVPEGLGGDIVFLTQGLGGPRLAALNNARICTLQKPPAVPSSSPGKPSAGRAILPGDFSGRYSLMANGQWSGTLMLDIDAGGTMTGQFRSDRNGSAYAVIGKVSADVPQKIEFTIQFPRARQAYEGYLWTEGKNAIAGTVSMLDHPYSFIAVREGVLLGSDIDLSLPKSQSEKVMRRVVTIEAGSERYSLDGVARTDAELTDALSKALKDKPATGVLLRVGDGVAFERVRRAAEAIRAAGVSSLRLSTAGEPGAEE
jgi:biopolymer transport protein ExbD